MSQPDIYGLTPDQYRSLVLRAGGTCEICRTSPHEGIDHDHASGLVRGLVCQRCNFDLRQVDTGRRKPRPAESAYLAVEQVGRGHRVSPIRKARVPDDLWAAAQARAEARGETLTAAILRFLRRYARQRPSD